MGCAGSNEKKQEERSLGSSLSKYPGLEDLSLGQVVILTSHNTYLTGLQVGSDATPEGIRNAIRAGARAVELDIFNDQDNNNDLLVSHGIEREDKNIYTTSAEPLGPFLQAIKEEAFKNTDVPMFITMENNTNKNEEAATKMANLYRETFGDLLYSQPINHQTPFRDIMGKVLIVTGGGNRGDFCPLVNAVWGNNGFTNWDSETETEKIAEKRDEVHRIYPTGDFSGALSRNFDGLPFIESGATFIALNMQTEDDNMKALIEKYFTAHAIRPYELAASN